MVSLTALWLPILLSTVAVFIASSIIHMVLPHHRTDYKKLPDEEKTLAALREVRLAPGNYFFPMSDDPKDMRSPELLEKYNQGPVGLMAIWPSGPPAMGKLLGQWSIFCLVMSFFVAYLASRTLLAGTDYLSVFRVVGTVAFLGYAGCESTDSIWRGQAWSTTVKNVIDGLVYALVTAGIFGWLWPS